MVLEWVSSLKHQVLLSQQFLPFSIAVSAAVNSRCLQRHPSGCQASSHLPFPPLDGANGENAEEPMSDRGGTPWGWEAFGAPSAPQARGDAQPRAHPTSQSHPITAPAPLVPKGSGWSLHQKNLSRAFKTLEGCISFSRYPELRLRIILTTISPR